MQRKPFTLHLRGNVYQYQAYTLDGRQTAPRTTDQRTKEAAEGYCNRLFHEVRLIPEVIRRDSTLNQWDAKNHFFTMTDARSSESDWPMTWGILRISQYLIDPLWSIIFCQDAASDGLIAVNPGLSMKSKSTADS